MAAGVLIARTGRAQNDISSPVDIEVPTVVLDTGPGNQLPTEDTQLDLANVVQSAAKGVTTVQEAPVIVTVITEDEIKDRQYHSISEAIDTVPGWQRSTLVHQFPVALVRGQVFAVQYLQDGTSMFDPMNNIATIETQPIETIKRIEMITGPGGVLWGSNSLVGILNVITKDADDVDGVEVGGTIGGGNGDRNNARAYLMYGDPDLAKGNAKLFVHGSFQTYQGSGFEMPSHTFSSPLPQPNGLIFESPLTQADPPQSYLFNLDGKLTLGKLQLRVSFPFGQLHTGAGFPGDVVRQHLGEDDRAECAPTSDPTMFFDPTNTCIDRGRTSRDNQLNYFDRSVVAEYRSRLAHGKAGISVKAYGIQFVRDMPHIQVLEPVPALLQGGLAFDFNLTAYRLGASLDGDVELPGSARLLYGAEGFNEFTINDTAGTATRQGPGTVATFIAPYDLSVLPVPCPHQINPTTKMVELIPGCPLTGLFPASRTVLGAYVDPQWRPSKKLILDVGARVQASPSALGLQSYDPNLTFSGTAVYNFLPGWHMKLNFAQGFRPPVFNSMVSNGEAVELGGSPTLKVETSQAEQGEINARIYKGERRIRELNFRVDYSYTTLHNFIQLVGGHYDNAADRSIHSVEFLAKLYVQGGHRVELGYTWNVVGSADRGQLSALPNNYFNLGAVFNLIEGKLTLMTNMKIVGAMEDPNRMVEYRDYGYDQFGHVISLNTMQPATLAVPTTSLVLDRLPPQADLQFGLSWNVSKKTNIRATVYNSLNGRYYVPDAFDEHVPRLEFQPYPYEDFRAYLSASTEY
ncbi:MAG TPA: TonB-dependent receptor [Kofleriaceae bacterium]|nr:TonB-dependent receptor [Kofleriaceae bacterium]